MGTMTTTAEKIKQSILTIVDGMLEKSTLVAEKGMPLHKLEKDIFAEVLKIGYHCIETALLQAGTGDVGKDLPLSNGKQLNRLDNLRYRCYLSVFGSHDIHYFAYGSREGQKIEHIPLAVHLSLPTEKYSYYLQDLTQAMCIETPYAKVDDFFTNLLPVSLPVSGLERTNKVLANSSQAYWEQQTPASEVTSEQLVVMQSDGKGVVIRPEKQSSPKVKTTFEAMTSSPSKKSHNGRKKMAVVGSVYTIECHKRTSNDVLESLFKKRGETSSAHDKKKSHSSIPKPLDKRIRTSLERDEKDTLAPARHCIFGWQQKEQRERDPNNKATHIYLMDGEKALWDTVAENSLGNKQVEILDILHAASYIWMASKALHPYQHNKDSLLDGFVKRKMEKVLQSEIKEVIKDFRALAASKKRSSKALEKIEKACTYLENHADRMKYHEYLANGYPIASGVIEGACRYIVKDRMERTGMRWVMSGAEAMLNLRCIALNGDWEAFMSFHIDKIQQQRYVAAANDHFFWENKLA
jgi:hypothetical protein